MTKEAQEGQEEETEQVGVELLHTVMLPKVVLKASTTKVLIPTATTATIATA